jgi:hypothetical protein
MRISPIILAVFLAGCRGSFEIPPAAEPTAVVVSPDDQRTPKCFVRARRFNGLVQLPCVDLIGQTRG